MVLEIHSDASPLVHALASTLLYSHIGAGLLALSSGFVAAAAKKGSGLHRRSGLVFVVSMIVMATIGAAVSPYLDPPQWTNVIAGVFTVYLVTSGYLTSVRRDETRLAQWLTFIAGAVIAICAFTVGSQHAANAGASYMFAGVTTLAAVGDARILAGRVLSANQRLIRHLWRMSYALLIAAASLFLGQQQLFPKDLHHLLIIPVLGAFVFMLFWMMRMRMRRPLAT